MHTQTLPLPPELKLKENFPVLLPDKALLGFAQRTIKSLKGHKWEVCWGPIFYMVSGNKPKKDSDLLLSFPLSPPKM